MAKLTQNQLITLIKKQFAEALPTPISDWDSTREGEGIWFRGSEDYAKDGTRIFNAYSEDDVHPKLAELLKDSGWYASPYDSGTLMAYPV